MTQTVTFTNPVHSKALEIIAAELEMEPAEFTLTGSLVDDYDADSLALISVVARFEKELGIFIPKSELFEMVDVQSIFGMLDQYAGATRA